ncbi:hypothetical protein FRC17_007947 [Serendipita sp. 399]|nr:hypothetical protein FRC17_007947 [Serendipita sp. 399]
MAAVEVMMPPSRPATPYSRKRRHSVSAPPPGFQLPFPHAPRPVSPLLTPSAATAAAVTPRRRVSTSPLSPQARSATLGNNPLGSRANIQRRLATYGEQGVAAASLATLEAACEQFSGCENIVMQINIDEKSPLRKKLRPSVPSDPSLSDSKPPLWNVRTFPFHRIRPGNETPRRRLGIPTFGWPKSATTTTTSTPMILDTAMMDATVASPRVAPRLTSDAAGLGAIVEMASDDETSVFPFPRRARRSGAVWSDNEAENPREGSLRCRSPSPAPPVMTGSMPPRMLKQIPKPMVKAPRRKSPPRDLPPPPPRYSSPLGPERHVLPPRPRFPRSMNSKLTNEFRLGKDGLRIQSLGERGAAADLYRRVLLRCAHFGARKREMDRLVRLAAQAEAEEETYSLKLYDDVESNMVPVVEAQQESQGEVVESPAMVVEGQEDNEPYEKMEVDAAECGDIELLPDIPDMD